MALCFWLAISNIPFKNVLQHLNLIYSEFDLCGISFSLQSSFKLVTIHSSRLLAFQRKSFPRKPVSCNFHCDVQNLGARNQECQQRLTRHKPELRVMKATNLSLFTGWDVFGAGLDVSPLLSKEGNIRLLFSRSQRRRHSPIWCNWALVSTMMVGAHYVHAHLNDLPRPIFVTKSSVKNTWYWTTQNVMSIRSRF